MLKGKWKRGAKEIVFVISESSCNKADRTDNEKRLVPPHRYVVYLMQSSRVLTPELLAQEELGRESGSVHDPGNLP